MCVYVGMSECFCGVYFENYDKLTGPEVIKHFQAQLE